MTDRAHRLVLFVCELVQMTADAGFVGGKVHLKDAALALVARSAIKLFVFLDAV